MGDQVGLPLHFLSNKEISHLILKSWLNRVFQHFSLLLFFPLLVDRKVFLSFGPMVCGFKLGTCIFHLWDRAQIAEKNIIVDNPDNPSEPAGRNANLCF